MGLSRSERLVLILLSIAIFAGRLVRSRLDRAGDLVVTADSAAARASRANAPPGAPATVEGFVGHSERDSATVPRDARSEEGGKGGERPAAAPRAIDVNRATVEELVLLPGIGPSKAAAIVERRRTLGPYVKISDLLDVPGIGPKTLAQLEGSVTVGEVASPAGRTR